MLLTVVFLPIINDKCFFSFKEICFVENVICCIFFLPLRLLKTKTTPSTGGKDKVGFVFVFSKEDDLLCLW